MILNSLFLDSRHNVIYVSICSRFFSIFLLRKKLILKNSSRVFDLMNYASSKFALKTNVFDSYSSLNSPRNHFCLNDSVSIIKRSSSMEILRLFA